ncbi:MAG: adenylyltransferase/cytidyltransferase family protein [Methylacidiphilales bacterium]|nr:adenylyltransferase/cytidyltransferase family protein [Candidatus Methylacidiphilales bacterium]MDW8349439.1 adenylyltransferase/cytidyltransferase family protein [Verrucomicrobiae bacterium]
MKRVVPLDEVGVYRAKLRAEGKKVVGTNGCFDILHYGHVCYLERARAYGDFLWVGINSDAAVRALKGDGRPINTAEDRAGVLGALRFVDAVTIFDHVRATVFLEALQPDVYVKGGDYTEESLDPEELKVLRGCGARIVIEPFVAGRSTTRIIERIANVR